MAGLVETAYENHCVGILGLQAGIFDEFLGGTALREVLPGNDTIVGTAYVTHVASFEFHRDAFSRSSPDSVERQNLPLHFQ